MTLKERYEKVINWFISTNAPSLPELKFSDNFSLLVAVMLSAQCTDKRVNMVTPILLTKYPNAESMSKASENELFSIISSISYPNSKAKHLKEMSTLFFEKFQGIVPNNLEDLTSLPGVGRKTANVVLAVAFNQPTMAVDTHVFRVSNRIGLVKSNSVLETEKQLVKHIPDEIIPKAHHWLILHGRYVCTARNPKCEQCGINTFCKYYNNNK